MIWVDYCILVVFLFSVLIGVWRGFTREVLSLMTWLLAFALAWFFGDAGDRMLASKISDPTLRQAAAYAVLFFGGLLIGAIITHFAVQAIRDSRFLPADRTLGGGIGVLRGFLVITVFVLVAGRMGAHEDRWWRESALISHFTQLADSVATLIPERWLEALKPAPQTSSHTPGQ